MVSEYYEKALFAVSKTLMRDYASKFFQDIASYIGRIIHTTMKTMTYMAAIYQMQDIISGC